MNLHIYRHFYLTRSRFSHQLEEYEREGWEFVAWADTEWWCRQPTTPGSEEERCAIFRKRVDER